MKKPGAAEVLRMSASGAKRTLGRAGGDGRS